MNARRPAPIGPLAILLRRVRSTSGGRHLAVLTIALAILLVAGITLLAIR